MFKRPKELYINWNKADTDKLARGGCYLPCALSKPKGFNRWKSQPDDIERIWIVFDLSCGERCAEGSTKSFLWVFLTEKEAKGKCRMHKTFPELCAKLSKPFLYELD